MFEEQEYVQRSYESDKKYINRFSYWYPRIKDITIFKIPVSKIIPVPIEVFAPFVCDCVTKGLPVIRRFVEESLVPEMSGEPFWFMKNGCFSNKFDFKHSLTDDLKVLSDFVAIQYASVCLETGGMSEIILREVIPWDRKTVATIYNGMPLRPEFRVFYDFDNRKVMYSANYWDYAYVRPNLYEKTDCIVFDAVRQELETMYESNRETVESLVGKAMADVDLTGRWSVDILMDGRGDFWLIDMAIAERSAYWTGGNADFVNVNHYEE